MNISVCGLICNDCQFYNKPCLGCYKVEGKTFWAKDHTLNGTCPIFECSVNKKGYKNCGECSDLPCQIYNDLKDPNLSEQEHLQGIKKRVDNLNTN